MRKAKYRSISPARIRPHGWLRRQLELQARGLSGALYRIWPDIRDSKWIGGDKDGWERVPYWLDGFIPLAFLLEDEELQKVAKRYVDAILDLQQPDGWICPCSDKERASYDMWAYLLILKVLTVWHDCTGDERVQPAMEKALACLAKHIKKHPLMGWGKYRSFEGLIAVRWLLERKPGRRTEKLAELLKEQGHDYGAWFDHFRHIGPVPKWTLDTHVVNLAMSLKAGALFSQFDGSDPDAAAEKALFYLMKYHGQAPGHFSGDECLAGTSPIHGAELCSIAEAMYSYEILMGISGSSGWGDALERLAFNSLPATISADMWTHQYDQQTNQISCCVSEHAENVFYTNGEESNVFGLEPGYGCCTANFNQAFPKYAASCIMQDDEGLVIASFAPTEAETEHEGKSLKARVYSWYPFRKQFVIVAEGDARCRVKVRIPAWAKKVRVKGNEVLNGSVDFGDMKQNEYCLEREGAGGGWMTFEKNSHLVKLTVEFDYDFELRQRPEGLRCLWYGPLLYSLPVQASKRMLEYERGGVERKYPWCDWELRPASPWNMAFAAADFEYHEGPMDDYPFGDKPACWVKATMAPIDWGSKYGHANAIPRSRKPVGEARETELIPYGCAKLRMTEMPLVGK